MEFLLWCQLLLVWSMAAYGITADPLKEEAEDFQWRRWRNLLACRIIVASGLTFALSHSFILSALLLLMALSHPILRFWLNMRWLAEFETCCIAIFLTSSLMVIRCLHLSTGWISRSILSAHLAALCVMASTLLMVVRGGTYIVRGVLRKAGTLKSDQRAHSQVKNGKTSPITIVAAQESTPMVVDAEEYNRGRLIGNLERIVLTVVVTAGSYAALAFLVAAKGIVRSEEFEKSRDFAEYFLIGSLSSVLVALAAGIVLRFTFVHLWPDLLTLQMQ